MRTHKNIMKTQFELDKPAKIDLHAYGINTEHTELPPGYVLPRQAVIPRLSVRNYFNDPITKQVLVHFFECRYPILVIDRDEYIENYSQINNEYIENRISELIAKDDIGFVIRGFTSDLNAKNQYNYLSNIKETFGDKLPTSPWAPFLAETPKEEGEVEAP
jgi:hypothetical protein